MYRFHHLFIVPSSTRYMFVQHKAKGGLIKLDIAVRGSKIEELKITGDFFIYPEEAVFELEKTLKGKSQKESLETIEDFLTEVEAPGITLEDFRVVLDKAFGEKNAV